MNYKSIIGAAMLLTVSAPLYAVPTVVNGITSTHGTLISNSGTSVTNELPVFTRQYSMFDAFSLSYLDVLAAVDAGGIYDGWNIATLTEATDFMNSAIVGSNQTSCGADWCIDGWSDGDFGASANAQYDYFAYVDGPAATNPADLRLLEFDSLTGSVGIINDLALASSDATQSINVIGSVANMLLWTDSPSANPLSQPTPAPEPGILALLSIGLLGMGVRRFKAKG